MIDDTIYLYLNNLNRKMKIFISFIMNIILCIAYCLCIDMVNIYKPIAHMDISMGILFSDRCHTHVPDFIDGYAGCAVYQTEIFNGTSNDHPHFAMECLYRGLSLSVVRLYGNIRPDLSDIHGNLMVLQQ